ncbi:MAG: hypothetical protein N2645_11245 [Clostridia bacterium]|nr:hypothetical protein [Clostridia bacterium]
MIKKVVFILLICFSMVISTCFVFASNSSMDSTNKNGQRKSDVDRKKSVESVSQNSFLDILICNLRESRKWDKLWVFIGRLMNSIDNVRNVEINGGIRIILNADYQSGKKNLDREWDSAKSIIETRLDSKGIFDRKIIVDKKNVTIIIEIYRKENQIELQKKLTNLGEPARLTFQEVDESKVNTDGSFLPTGKIIVEGAQVKDAKVILDRYNEANISLVLNKEGAKKFEEATKRLIGKKIGIFLDKEMITAPTVLEKISGGEATITGQRNIDEANELAQTIRAGALPFRLKIKEIKTYAPLI